MSDFAKYLDELHDERGYREVGLREMKFREWASLRVEKTAPQGRDWQRLIWRLQAKKYWAAMNPVSKARIKAYRRQWAIDHRERMNALTRARRAKKGRHPSDAKYKKKVHAAERLARHQAALYECEECGVSWGVVPWLRLPTRRPRFCSIRCRNRSLIKAKIARGECLHCGAPARSGRRTCARHRSEPARRADRNQRGHWRADP